MSSLTLKLYDLQTNELADISGIAFENTFTRRHDHARSWQMTMPAGHALLTAIADDGFPNLKRGMRKLIAWENGGPGDQPLFHGRLFLIERTGDGNENLVTATFFDPWMELGYESEDRAGRPVRDVTGNFIDPSFVSSVDDGPAISGPDLLYQVLVNSQQTGDETDPTPGEGPLPIFLDPDNFDFDVPPAIDLSMVAVMDWPVLIGDFAQTLVQTNVVDIDMRPLDPSEQTDPYHMVEISARSLIGVDRSGTVHFDYWTGSRNAKGCRMVEDFATVNNKLYDYLGPRIDQRHWAGNIVPGAPGTTVDPSTSRSRYGVFMSIRAFDALNTENGSRPLYIALWNAEQGLRVEPRDLLFVTPNPDSKALFDAPQDFDAGDTIAVNTGDDFGVTLAESQRCYGYSKVWDRQRVARLSELLTSADAA